MTKIISLRLPTESLKDYNYVACVVTAWKNWSIKSGVKFVLLNSDQGDFKDILNLRYGTDSRIVIVDADDLVSWNATPETVFGSPKIVEILAKTPTKTIERIIRDNVIVRFLDVGSIPSIWSRISPNYL